MMTGRWVKPGGALGVVEPDASNTAPLPVE
jgi:hypothetical protein